MLNIKLIIEIKYKLKNEKGSEEENQEDGGFIILLLG